MTYEGVSDNQELKSALVISGVAHLILILILSIRAYFFPSEPLKIESAIRVDIVGLPEKTKSLPPPMPDPVKDISTAVPPPSSKTLPPIEKTKPVPTAAPVVLKPTKPENKKRASEQSAALKRLEAFAKLEREAKAEAANKALEAAKAAQGAVRGNQISKGNSLTGLTRLDHARYLDDLEARIKSHWRLPKFLSNSQLRVRIIIQINSSGTIIRRAVVQPSGNNVFDQSALEAISASEPLPAPPDTLQGILANQGVELDLEPNTTR